MAGMHDPPASRSPGLLGPALALPVLAGVVVGAGAARPAWGGDGAWTTPLEVLLAVVALALLGALVLVVRNLPGGVPRGERGSSRRRWWVLAAAAAVGVLAWLSGVAAREPGSTDGGIVDLGPLPGLPGEGVAPLPTTATAVVAGLVALGLGAVLVTLLVGRQLGRRPARGDVGTTMAAPSDDSPALSVPDGPPDEVVLAAWAVARREVVAWLGGGEHDPPGGLLRRVAGTPVAASLRRLTGLYLPVRYGRSPATSDDAEAARRTLDEVRDCLSAPSTTGGGP